MEHERHDSVCAEECGDPLAEEERGLELTYKDGLCEACRAASQVREYPNGTDM